MKKHTCIVAFHIGHSPYTMKEFLAAEKRDDLECCGGTMVLEYCPICGKQIKFPKALK